MASLDLEHNYVCSDIFDLFDIIDRMDDNALEFGENYRIEATVKRLVTGSWHLNLKITNKEEDVDQRRRIGGMLQ